MFSLAQLQDRNQFHDAESTTLAKRSDSALTPSVRAMLSALLGLEIRLCRHEWTARLDFGVDTEYPSGVIPERKTHAENEYRSSTTAIIRSAALS